MYVDGDRVGTIAAWLVRVIAMVHPVHMDVLMRATIHIEVVLFDWRITAEQY